jgi:hypothetical protein
MDSSRDRVRLATQGQTLPIHFFRHAGMDVSFLRILTMQSSIFFSTLPFAVYLVPVAVLPCELRGQVPKVFW